MARIRVLWQSILDHPILCLELRRVHRKRWWPGRRFFMLYPAALGAALGCGIAFVLGDLLKTRLAAVVSAVPAACLLSGLAWLLGFALPWIAPALTAAVIARERELGTFDLLRTTLLTERSIVLGKLGGCAVRLWPGVLALVLLTPFQVAWAFGGVASGFSGLPLLALLAAQPGFDIAQLWAWLLLAGVAGLLKPWSDLAFHAAVGLVVSVLSRSVGVALAISYGAILAVRAMAWLATSLLLPVLLALVASPGLGEPYMAYALVGPGLASLAVVIAEMVAGLLLTWAAIWWLKRV
jgi:hypothetical protein